MICNRLQKSSLKNGKMIRKSEKSIRLTEEQKETIAKTLASFFYNFWVNRSNQNKH